MATKNETDIEIAQHMPVLNWPVFRPRNKINRLLIF